MQNLIGHLQDALHKEGLPRDLKLLKSGKAPSPGDDYYELFVEDIVASGSHIQHGVFRDLDAGAVLRRVASDLNSWLTDASSQIQELEAEGTISPAQVKALMRLHAALADADGEGNDKYAIDDATWEALSEPIGATGMVEYVGDEGEDEDE
jgi:hypothetical protein